MFAGVAADRRRLLLSSQFVQMTCAFILAALFAFGHAQVWHILTLSFVVGTAQAFGAPAYQSLIPSLVPREHLSNAIAMNSIQFNLARVIGPVIGGLALTNLGAAWCFGMNGVSYIAVIVSLSFITVSFLPAPSKETVMESMKGGIAFIRAKPEMLPLIWVAFFCTFLGIPLIVFLPVFAKDVFGGNAGTYTILLSVEGRALAVAARQARRRARRNPRPDRAGRFRAAFAWSRPDHG